MSIYRTIGALVSVLMSSLNFMHSKVEHQKYFITSGPVLLSGEADYGGSSDSQVCP